MSQTGANASAGDFKQDDVHDEFVNLGTGEFTVVFRSWWLESWHGAIYSAFAPPPFRMEALTEPTWNLTIGSYGGSFVSYHDSDGKRITEYERDSDDGLEPLVLSRTFYDAKPSYLEISEEFRLFHNLYESPDRRELIHIRDDGTEEIAATIKSDREVKVRTRLLRQYQAARQLLLLIFIDSSRTSKTDEKLPKNAQWIDDSMNSARFGSSHSFGSGTVYVGTRVFDPPPPEKSGRWPFDRDEHYPDFLIGHNSDGDEVRFTCNPKVLANYFGANPEAPHYLTSVHFDKAVLKKYYDKPELYSVEDGYLRCAALWGLRMDNDHSDRVIVHLGDLGERLPKGERDYWRSFNISPDVPMSETGVRRAFLNQSVGPKSVDLRFVVAYKRLERVWRRHEGWDLFRPMAGIDAKLLQQVRVPLSESQSEFEALLSILARILPDSLNDAELDARLTARVANERSIGKLERWLHQEAYGEAARDIARLRTLQTLRSKSTAHRKGSDYDVTLTRLLGDVRGRAAGLKVLGGLVETLEGLAEWCKIRSRDTDVSGLRDRQAK